MTTWLGLRDDLLNAQLLRAVGAAAYDGADVGECVSAAHEVKRRNLDTWYDAWTSLADRVWSLAVAHEQAGDRETARRAYLRSCTYYRTAGVMLYGTKPGPRQLTANVRQRDAFRQATALMAIPPEVIAIPFEGSTLPGYFFRATTDGRPRATVILTGGYDGTCEELYFYNGAAAISRGYHVLAFDGPGQGAALLQQQLTMRPDWHSVIGPVLDDAFSRPDVDPTRVALIGLSLGGFLAPRAASDEHRLAAVIADCGSYDLQASFLARMPAVLARRYRAGSPVARRVVGQLLNRVARQPTAGWALRRGQQVHGVASPLDYLDTLAEYTLEGHSQRISCPTWVCNAEGDDIAATAPALFASLTVDKQFVHFTANEGAGDHCEAGARTLYHARSFGWLDDLLKPSEPGF